MKEIGGYFELELSRGEGSFLHSDGCPVNSGRHALEYILRSLGDKVTKVWLPYYTCDVVLQPFIRLGLEYGFYNTNPDFEIASHPDLKAGEYIIANNYFGIKDSYIRDLAGMYGDRLIVDNAQAWYAPVLPGIKSFYSPRKFFGVPDGGVAYIRNAPPLDLEVDYSADRCSHLLKRIDENATAGYVDFRTNSDTLNKDNIKRMSKLTKSLLSSINMEKAKETRLANFHYLSEYLNSENMLNLPATNCFDCPMVYPFMSKDPSLRKRLIENKVYVATYWPNVLKSCSEDTPEYQLTQDILPLPVDQRYGKDEMKKIIDIIL